MLDGLICNNRCAVFAVKDRNWHSPCSLTRDTPVFTVANHIVQPCFSPARIPVDLFNFLQYILAKILNRSKPLRCCSENRRFFRSPVMWIRVGNKPELQQGTDLFQFFCHGFVRVIVKHSFKTWCFFSEHSFFIYRAKRISAVAFCHIDVVFPVPWRRMHTAGSGICCNMFTEHNERIAIVEWMFGYYSVSLFSFERLNDFGIFPFQFRCYMIEKLMGDDILFIFDGYNSVL